MLLGNSLRLRLFRFPYRSLPFNSFFPVLGGSVFVAHWLRFLFTSLVPHLPPLETSACCGTFLLSFFVSVMISFDLKVFTYVCSLKERFNRPLRWWRPRTLGACTFDTRGGIDHISSILITSDTCNATNDGNMRKFKAENGSYRMKKWAFILFFFNMGEINMWWHFHC